MVTSQQQIVVIGAGYAGLLATVRLAGKTRKRNVRITLVNASDMFVERLRLHQLAANTVLKQRPLVDILHGTGVEFQKGVAMGIDTARRVVTVQTETDTQQLSYDYLLYTLGSAIERESVPGLREYAYTLTPTGPLSALPLREKLATLNTVNGRIVVCGGGATGIESAAEFAQAYPQLEVRLVTRGEFGAFLKKPIAVYMRQSLSRLGVTIQDHISVTEVTADQVLTANGAALPCDLCLWTGGFSVASLAREAGLTVNDSGQILIDPFMRSVSHPEIYAAGDAAQSREEPGVALRMSAVTAVITGAHAADCLSNALNGKTPKPFSFAYIGQGIALGHHNAIGFNNYPADIPTPPYFTGRIGYEFREFFVRLLAALPLLEKRWPGFLFWPGKGRYAAAQRRAQRNLAAQLKHPVL